MDLFGGLKFVQAESEEMRRAIYRLRYQVYVEEFGFERPEDHPGGLETDEYEPHSRHLAAVNEAGEIIGTMRMVHHSEKGFPIEHATPVRFVGERPPAERIIEISRLAISRDYRRRIEDGLYGVESYIRQSEGGVLPDSGAIPPQYEKRLRPIIVLGLYQLMYHMSKRLGITHWFMITEKKLWHTLTKYNMIFHQIGEPVEYHGIRIPYLGIVREMEEHMLRTNPQALQIFLLGLEPQYHPTLEA